MREGNLEAPTRHPIDWQGADFHDEALAGKWKGSRSSRLGDQWRVIYRVVPEQLTYYIESVTPHDYRRP